MPKKQLQNLHGYLPLTQEEFIKAIESFGVSCTCGKKHRKGSRSWVKHSNPFCLGCSFAECRDEVYYPEQGYQGRHLGYAHIKIGFCAKFINYMNPQFAKQKPQPREISKTVIVIEP